MAKPEPRPFKAPAKSRFADHRPTAPAAPPAEEVPTSAPEDQTVTPLVQDRSRGGAPTETERPKKPKKKKANFYQTEEDEARAQAAWRHTMGHTGIRYWTEYVEEAVRQFTRDLERDYNDSRPFS